MRIFACVLFFIANIAHSQVLQGHRIDLNINFSEGKIRDGGHLSWNFFYCDNRSSYVCFVVDVYPIKIAVPKNNIKIGSYWYFSGMKYFYVADTKEDEILVAYQISEEIARAFPNACVACLNFVTIKDKSKITSIFSTYPKSDLDIKNDTWKYSEGYLSLSKIPKEFPAEQIFSVEEVNSRSREDWVPAAASRN